MRATIKDVAKLADVSISTVSRVLNSPDSVSEEKRERVLKAIEKLNYRPNALARGLIFKRTQTIGVLMPEISNLFSAELIKGIEEQAHAYKINLILCNTSGQKEKMLQYLNVLKEKHVDGIIFTSKPITEEYYHIFKSMGVPTVLAATESLEYDIPSVKIHDEKAAYDATAYLIEKGHRNIGMISGPTTDTIAGFPRLMGYKQALKEKLNIDSVNELIEFGNYQFEDGYRGMKNLLMKNKDLTAVFCASDEMALGALTYLNEIGLKVPDNISIMGFDNTKMAKMSIPKLTTVAQPISDIGRMACEKLIKRINSEEVAEIRTYLDHKIIERDSVRPPQ